MPLRIVGRRPRRPRNGGSADTGDSDWRSWAFAMRQGQGASNVEARRWRLANHTEPAAFGRRGARRGFRRVRLKLSTSPWQHRLADDAVVAHSSAGADAALSSMETPDEALSRFKVEQHSQPPQRRALAHGAYGEEDQSTRRSLLMRCKWLVLFVTSWRSHAIACAAMAMSRSSMMLPDFRSCAFITANGCSPRRSTLHATTHC